MVTSLHTFTDSLVWEFTGSWLGGTATSSVFASVICYGAGGHGHRSGTGGSGGAYAQSLTDILLVSGSKLHIVVGKATSTDGGTSSFSVDDGPIIVQAAGGKCDGTVAHQTSLTTGSWKISIGGLGGGMASGYSNHNGGGGGGGGGYLGDGASGQSGNYAGRSRPARGGLLNNVDSTSYGGSGSYYESGARQNLVVSAGNGATPACGGGGGYDYPDGRDTSGSGGDGVVIVVLTDS